MRPRQRIVAAAAGVVAALLGGAYAVRTARDATGSDDTIVVNQVGYAADGPKRATLLTDADEPLPWSLHDADGDVVVRGRSEPRGLDRAVGANTHVVDFSDATRTGDDFTLAAGDARSLPFDIGVAEAYASLAKDALDYFYPARSGIDIDGDIAGTGYARPAGHDNSPADGRANQGDLDVPCQSVASQTDAAGELVYGSAWECPDGYTLDVVGGWYDAGDHGKYVVTGAFATANLLSAFERDPARFTDRAQALPEAGNGVPDVLDEARWELEWMMSMQVPAGTESFRIGGEPVDLSGLVHHKVHDEGWTDLPRLPHEDDRRRSLHRPSTAATLSFAAAAAQGARLWDEYDAEFADELLAAATRAFDTARSFPDALYAPIGDGSDGGGPYGDDTVADEFYWAAAELYLTTGSPRFLEIVRSSPLHHDDVFPDAGYSWRSVAALGRLSLAAVASELPDRAAVQESVVAAADELLALQSEQSTGQPYAGRDGHYEWGSNGQLLNNLVVLSVAHDLTGAVRYREGVLAGVDYLLGRNALGWSYVTGYGAPGRTSANQHHRWWAAALDAELPHPPPGAVAGGPKSDAATWDPAIEARYPDAECAPQRCYVDEIESWSTNELAVNWNAALVRVASYLATATGQASPDRAAVGG